MDISKELLSLVLEEECYDLELKPQIGFHQRLFFRMDNREENINLDTLTRLMKEWCHTLEYCVISYKVQGYVNWTVEVDELDDDRNYISDDICTEFEAVLKATIWIAKERNLI